MTQIWGDGRMGPKPNGSRENRPKNLGRWEIVTHGSCEIAKKKKNVGSREKNAKKSGEQGEKGKKYGEMGYEHPCVTPHHSRALAL